MIINGDCLQVLPTLEPESIDSIVTDPAYGMGFMGKKWDRDVPGVPFWQAALRVAKPGAYLLSFGHPKTFHRLMVAIEDAEWEIHNTIMWVYGQGFPKSLDVSKAIDRMAGMDQEIVERGEPVKRMVPGADQHKQNSWIKDGARVFVPSVTAPVTDKARKWKGWGTALKPAWEPIIVARKPVRGSVAENVLKYGTGAMNIDACRVPVHPKEGITDLEGTLGRWPANLIHDGSDEVLECFPEAPGQQASVRGNEPTLNGFSGPVRFGGKRKRVSSAVPRIDSGSAARFFYCAKASRRDRNEGLADPGPRFKHGTLLSHVRKEKTLSNNHPTVKPTALMCYLCRLVTPPGGTILDMFCGSGSTGKAAEIEGFNFIGIELEAESAEIARKRTDAVRLPLFG